MENCICYPSAYPIQEPEYYRVLITNKTNANKLGVDSYSYDRNGKQIFSQGIALEPGGADYILFDKRGETFQLKVAFRSASNAIARFSTEINPAFTKVISFNYDTNRGYYFEVPR